MIVYAVLGTAPLGADRMALPEVGHWPVMISFHDYGKSFDSLTLLNQAIKEKHHERQANHQPRTAG